MFLTNPVSDALLTQIAELRIKHAKKGTGATLYIAYNVELADGHDDFEKEIEKRQ